MTHFDSTGRARMVDITAKPVTERMAKARGVIRMKAETLAAIRDGATRKGDVIAVARIAGIMAAKRTSELVPLCHPIPLTGVNISFQWDIDESAGRYVVRIEAEAKTKGVTGVEMEALTAASAAAHTIYDMCKAAGKDMMIGPTYLQHKSGGKNGDYDRS